MSRAALALTCAVLLTAVALFSLAPAGRAASPAQAPSEPIMTVTMFGNSLTYAALSQEVVLAELTHPDGSRATGEGMGTGSGQAYVVFFQMAAGAGDTTIRPGDTITLAKINQRPISFVVPNVTADVDTAGDRVVGTAPAGVPVLVEIAYGTPSMVVSRTVTADAAGRFALDLSGQVDLPEGDAAGSATYDTPQRHRFVAEFAAFSGEITIDAHQVRGVATAGTHVDVEVRHTDGSGVDPSPFEVTGGNGWSVSIGSPYDESSGTEIRIGDVVTVTRTGGPLGVERTTAAVVPDIDLELDPARERVSGVAPPDTTIEVVASSLFGASASTTATTTHEGTFAADLGGLVNLGPGWRVRASVNATPDMRIGRLAVLQQALVGVHTPSVRGLARPGARITVTLTSAVDAQAYSSVTYAGDQGNFSTSFGGYMPGTERSIEPGDQIDVTYVSGDPLTAVVPDLSAITDVAGDRIVGRALPGSEVRVVVRSDAAAPVLTATADSGGAYAAGFGGQYDLQRGADGTVTVNPSSNLAFYTTWASLQINTQLAGRIAVVMVNGAPGREYSARLVGPDGQVVGQSSGRSYDLSESADAVMLIGSAGFFYLIFTDVAGDMVDVRAGDRIEIQAGDDQASVTVPMLEATIFVDEDVVAGRASPGMQVIIRLQSASGDVHTAVAMADDKGTFAYDFADTYDVQYNDSAQLIVIIDGHTVIAYVSAPGLVVDLDGSTVSGYLAVDAGTKVRVTVRRGETDLYDTSTSAGVAGAIAVQVADQAGLIELLEGDRLVVQPTDPMGDAVTMDIPEVTIEADSASDVVSGRATPGGSIVVLVLDNLIRVDAFPLAQAWPEIGATGSWVAQTVPHFNVRPGSVVTVQYRVTAGHVAIRTHYVPLAGVEHGGPNVCGYANPRKPVSAGLHDPDGSQIGSAASLAAFDGRYQMVLRDTGGATVNALTGRSVRAVLSGTAVEVTLPVLEAAVDWQAAEMTGRGPADSGYLITYPAQRCLESQDFLNLSLFFDYGTSDADGSFSASLLQVEPGEGFDVTFYSEGDHRVYRQIYRLLGQVFIETNRVSGTTNSSAAAVVALASPDGTPRAAANATADENGQFDAHLEEGTVIRAGDVVTITAGGDVATIVVEPLGFDWSPGEPVVGSAPPLRPLTLQLKLRSGRVLSISLTVAADGTYRFGAEDVPPRATWTWNDVTDVRVVLETTNGHQIISQTDDFEMPASAVPYSVFLPYTQRGTVPAGGGTATMVGQSASLTRHTDGVVSGAPARLDGSPTLGATMGPALAARSIGAPLASSLSTAIEPGHQSALMSQILSRAAGMRQLLARPETRR